MGVARLQEGEQLGCDKKRIMFCFSDERLCL